MNILINHFKKAIEEVKEEVFHKINKINVTIDEQIEFILLLLELKEILKRFKQIKKRQEIILRLII